MGEFTYNPEDISKENIIETINQTKNYQAKEASCVGANNINAGHFDLIILGGGPTAFSAAITAENLGLSALIVNEGLDFGGTCVNVGCVPSKSVIRARETDYRTIHSNFTGIKSKRADIDFAQVIKDKKKLVSTLQQQNIWML